MPRGPLITEPTPNRVDNLVLAIPHQNDVELVAVMRAVANEPQRPDRTQRKPRPNLPVERENSNQLPRVLSDRNNVKRVFWTGVTLPPRREPFPGKEDRIRGTA